MGGASSSSREVSAGGAELPPVTRAAVIAAGQDRAGLAWAQAGVHFEPRHPSSCSPRSGCLHLLENSG